MYCHEEKRTRAMPSVHTMLLTTCVMKLPEEERGGERGEGEEERRGGEEMEGRGKGGEKGRGGRGGEVVEEGMKEGKRGVGRGENR